MIVKFSHLKERPNVIDEGASQQQVDDNEHHQAEHVQGEAAELLPLNGL